MHSFGGKHEGKKPLVRLRRRWEDNIMTDIQEVECGAMHWIDPSQTRYRRRAHVNVAMILPIP